MRRSTILFAAVSSVVSSASLSQATFTIIATPATGNSTATDAGKFAYNLAAMNDVGGADGDKLKAVNIYFTGLYGTKVFFNTKQNRTPDNPDTDEDESVPIDNSYSANVNNYESDGSLVVVNRNASNLRIGSVATIYVDNPGDTDTVLTTDQATNGLSTWHADYEALNSAMAAPATSAAGARFARLVFNTPTPTFRAVVTIAGETGPGVEQTFMIGETPNTAPTVAAAAATVVFGPVVSNGAPFSATVNVTDAEGGLIDLAQVGAITGGTVTGLTITPAGGANAPAAFTVSGTVAYAPFGTTVNIPLVATDHGGGFFGPPLSGNGVLTLTLTPEPASMVALAGAAALGAMRRRR